MSFRLALDAGHGINTPGKRTPDGIREWTLNSKVCNYVEKLCMSYDIVIKRLDDVTGKTDRALSSSRLKDAIAFKPDAMVSVHHNAGGTTATGIEVLVHPNPSPESVKLANLISKKMSSYTGLRNRGVKNETAFTMVSRKNFPTVLTEGGFMDGKSDTKIIRTSVYQEAYAKAIVDSLVEIYKIKKLANPSTSKVYAKTTANLNLRQNSSSGAKITIVIPKSTKVLIKSFKDDEWAKVIYATKDREYSGYCSRKYLDIQ